MLSLFSHLDHFSLLRVLYITLTFLPHLHQPPNSFISLSTTSLALSHIYIDRLFQFSSLLMESVAPKRPRPQEEEEVNSEESLKRQKPYYSHILSLLESEEEESSHDLSPLITTLQQEITSFPSSSSSSSSDETLLAPPPAENSQQVVVHPETSETPFTPPVMRHLLEASDDELGIPHSTTGWDFGDDYNNMFSGGFMNNTDASEDINGFANSLCDGLWELEDETANYYTLLQSQLFL